MLALQGKLEEALPVLEHAIAEPAWNPVALRQARRPAHTVASLTSLTSPTSLTSFTSLTSLTSLTSQLSHTSQALTQRALLRELRGDEEGARADFERAAAMGSAFARQEAVRLNPYARLCNQMLARAMREPLFS